MDVQLGLIPNRTDIVMATANPYIEHSISHNIGIYVWGFYQVTISHFSTTV